MFSANCPRCFAAAKAAIRITLRVQKRGRFVMRILAGKPWPLPIYVNRGQNIVISYAAPGTLKSTECEGIFALRTVW